MRIACQVVVLWLMLALAAGARVSGQVLPTDPTLVTGELENGLRYIVKRNANPPGRATMWIHFNTGSLNETERQRGIAHYLEHMAFNGSEHFPPGSVVPLFQSLGMTFGRDQNAFTSFDQTVYQLSLPDTLPDTMGKGMRFFADLVSGLLLSPEEIESERQVIQEERRRGLSGRQRTSFYVIERIAPGSIYGDRIPIGTEETINGLTRADFLDYYGKWYTASNATLMVVADAEPADVVAMIRESLGGAPKLPRPTPQAVGVKAYESSFAIVANDPELRSAEVRITRLEPARSPTTTAPQFRDDLVAALGTMAMNRRFEERVSGGGASYLNARADMGSESNAIYTAELFARPVSGKWKEALEESALELQRARAFGFSPRELEDAKKELRSRAERAVEVESTRPSGAIIGQIAGNVASGEPTMSATQRLELISQFLATITADEVDQRFAREFDTKAVSFVAVLPSGPDVPTEAQLLEIGTKALAVTPTRETESVHATMLMETLPKPGAVLEGAEHAASKVWSGWLGNNVRVHHRFMDERKNQVAISISLIGGELLESAENRGITQAAQLAWSRRATRHLTSSDIREITTGSKVSVRGGGGGGRGGRGGRGSADSISLSISGSPEELEQGFQLAHLLLTEPVIEAASFEQFRTSMRDALQESMQNPMMLGMRAVTAAPYPDNEPRTQPLTIEQLDRLTLKAAQEWLEKLIVESPIEVTVVGDLSRERAMELAARYLGSLAARPRVGPETFAKVRHLKRPEGPRVIERSLSTPTPQAFVYSGFYGANEGDIADVRALNLASQVLSTRMVKEVREDAQLVYSIGASSRAATTYPGFGTFSAAAPTEPSKVSALVDKIASMYAAFAKSGPTEEELDVARKQIANTLDEQMKDPAFWSGRLDQLTYRGARLDDVVNAPEAYQAISAAQIREAFAKYYNPDEAIIVIVTPEPAESPAAPVAPMK